MPAFPKISVDLCHASQSTSIKEVKPGPSERLACGIKRSKDQPKPFTSSETEVFQSSCRRVRFARRTLRVCSAGKSNTFVIVTE